MAEGFAELTAPPTSYMLDQARAAAEEAGETFDAKEVQGSLNPAQLKFIRLATEVQLFLGGFGAGKTFVGAWKVLLHLLTNPGCTGLAIAPIFSQCRVQYRAVMLLLERMAAISGVNLISSTKMSNGQGEIVLVTGATLLFRTAGSKTGLFGLNVAFIWIDELELCEDPDQTFEDAYSRLRQQSDGATVEVNRYNVYLTSTAHYLTGLLSDLIRKAKREKAAFKAGERETPPKVGYVVAPSTQAIGYGMSKDRIDAWAENMDADTFLRAVMCVLMPPPEVIFADVFRDEPYPFGNLVDYTFNKENKTYVLIDWGTWRPHVLITQKVESWDALVVIDEYGPEGSSVADTVTWCRKKLQGYGLVDARGHPTARRQFAVIGDPTTNPGARRPTSDDNMLALEGRAAVNSLKWPYTAPTRPEQRAKRRQIQFGRALLRPRLTKPRVLISTHLAVEKEARNRHKETRRGVHFALTQGYKNKKRPDGTVLDEPNKDQVWDHAIDALLYGLVVIFSEDFFRLYDVESGLYTGAAGW